MKGIKKYVKPLPIRYIILVFFLIIIICILFFKSKQGFLVTSGGIVTIAGTGAATISAQNTASIPGTSGIAQNGDGGLAVNATLYSPYGGVIDSSGNIYISDTMNYRIRKVDTDGIISTIAGKGQVGYTGEDVPAINATLASCVGLAIDSSRNIYIIQSIYNRIRKLTLNADKTTYNISTIAGTGVATTSAQNRDSKPGIIGIAPNGDGGPAKSATLNYPQGIAVDSDGNIYISDTNNLRIRKLTLNADKTTYNISTIAGTGQVGSTGDGGPALSATLNGLNGLAVDSSGNIYFTESNRIRKLTLNADKSTYNISRIAGTGLATTSAQNTANPPQNGDEGPAISATFNLPREIAVDLDGNIYITDSSNHRIRKIDKKGIITTVAGNGRSLTGIALDNYMLPTDVQIKNPYGIAVDSSGNIYVSETGGHRIRKIYK